MKALSTLKSAINQSSTLAFIALITIVPMLYPELGIAAELQTSGQQPAVVFQINNPSVLDSQNQKSINFQQITNTDPLVVKVKEYLEDHDSPLADSAAYIVTEENWERALAISFVESNMCRFTPKYYAKGKVQESYNCSGIGGDNYKRYTSYEDWFADMNDLLSKPNYTNRPIEKFIGYYVVPGSRNWLNGVKKTEADLNVLEAQASQERQNQLAAQINPALALANIQK